MKDATKKTLGENWDSPWPGRIVIAVCSIVVYAVCWVIYHYQGW